jgi:hypothetical protein
MRPLRLSVPGQFWDSLLYRGRLYLMRLDGVAEVIDWHKAVQSLRTDASTAIAREAAFSRSDFLYAAAYSPVLSDPEIKRAVSQLLQQKLERLAEWELELTPRTRAKCVVASRELPMPFPYADALIYSNRLYVAANDGIYGAGVGKNLRYGISTRPERLWDCPAFGLAASWGHLALAAGEEGLFEHALGHSSISDEAVPVVASHVSSCAYAFQRLTGRLSPSRR